MTRRPFFPFPPSSPLPVPNAQMDDEPIRCLHINGEWLVYLSGIVERLADYWRYELDSQEEYDHIYNQVQHLIQNITDAAECEPEMTLQNDYVQCEHWAVVGGAGGASVANAWTILPINRIKQDHTGVSSLAGNQITLPAGRWKFTASHVLRAAGGVSGRLRVTFSPVSTPSVDFHYYSLNQRFPGDGYIEPVVSEIFNLSEDFLVEMYYYVNAAQAVNGLGIPLSIGSEDEVYGRIILERLSLVEV